MPYTLGLDIGIASVGFAAVDSAQQKILLAGVRLFEAAENPKTGASLAEPRRTKRGMRRVIHRRKVRKNTIRRLLEKHGLTQTATIDQPIQSPYEPDVWQLRQQALKRKLEDEELIRVLFHIAKRRGFQSNRKGAEPNDTDGKKALSGAKELQEAMIQAGAETIGAYLADKSKKRNGDGSYENFVDRSLLRTEVATLMARQRKLGQSKASAELEQAFIELAFFQRPLRSSEELIGYCTFEETEKRAPRFSYTAELFVLWSKLNNTRIKDRKSEERPLTQDEKLRLANKAHSLKKFTYAQARKELGLTEDERFNLSYRRIKDEDDTWEKLRDRSENTEFLRLTGYHTIRDALDTGSIADWQSWIGPKRDKLDEIARLLSALEDKSELEKRLAELGLSPAECNKLVGITSFSKVVDLSLVAMRKIIPHLQQGLMYDKACEAAGYNHSAKANKGLSRLTKFNDVRNPVVNRALAQARKVINAVIRELGLPEMVIIELARDVGKRFEDRKALEKEQKKNESYRAEAKKHVAEILGIIPDNVSGEDVLKYRLWKEQEGFCPYSGIYITPEVLRDPLATQIDHIIPYSRSWNDSYMNKILCLTSENQSKSGQTALEYFARAGRNREALEAMAAKLPRKKAENILIENFDETKGKEWKDRALNDTRYMARLLKSHVEQSLKLGDGNRVQTRNGMLTAKLRGAWGFPNKNRKNDRHHALDAIVLACSTQSMVQKLSQWDKYQARAKNPQKWEHPPAPWENFRKDGLAAVDKVFVSRMPVRKITGAAHEETIRSIRYVADAEGGTSRQIIQRVKLSSLKLDMLENLVDKERNQKLYDVLKARLDAHDGKPDKAFAQPVFMPVNDPTTVAPQIKSVRVVTNEKSGIPINGGLASNGDMVRVDVFRQDGKYHLVPVYVHHFAQKALPNRAVVAFKPEEEWTVVTDDNFLFSLYRNDYVVLKGKKETVEGYYVGTHRGTGCVSIRAHDNDPSFGKEGTKEGIGVKTMLAFEKYSVDIFGRRHRITQEKRLGVAHGDDPESGEAELAEDAT